VRKRKRKTTLLGKVEKEQKGSRDNVVTQEEK
jgi:hypothetical protein